MTSLIEVGVVVSLAALLAVVIQLLPRLRPPWPVEDLEGATPGVPMEMYARQIGRHGFPSLRWKDGIPVPGEAAVLKTRVRREVRERSLPGLAPERWRGLLPCLGLEIVDRGSLTVTTHRLLYSGEAGSLSLAWAENPAFAIFARGLLVEVPGSPRPVFFRTPHAHLVKTAAGILAGGEWRLTPRRRVERVTPIGSLASSRPAGRTASAEKWAVARAV